MKHTVKPELSGSPNILIDIWQLRIAFNEKKEFLLEVYIWIIKYIYIIIKRNLKVQSQTLITISYKVTCIGK